MAPNSPPPLRQVPPQPTLAPSPTTASGAHSRSPPRSAPRSPILPSPRIVPRHSAEPSSSSSRARPTIAEAYATANYPKGRDGRADKENHLAAGVVKTKPIFEWITRKLGGGRRATYSDGSGGIGGLGRATTPRSRGGGAGPAGKGGAVGPMSPQQIFGSPGHGSSATRANATHISRAESHSLRSYSMSYATSVNSAERDRRRIANNPYPSIPVPPAHRDSTVGSLSASYLSRSRTPSLRSEASRPRTMVDVDDSSTRWTGADEDASIRPFPPSHPSSPTPSHSFLSRSASTSLLSPTTHQPQPRSPLHRPRTNHSASSSTDFSDEHGGRQSRQDSTSTKPTTILSFDSGPHLAHIAQAPASASAQPAPPTPVSPLAPSLGHIGHSAPGSPLRNTSISASAPPTALPSPNAEAGSSRLRSSSSQSPRASPRSASPRRASLELVQAPKHSQPHPRDNPHPSSPPGDNASTLTLASSTFAAVPTPTTASPLSPGSATPHLPGPAAARLRELTTSAGPSFTGPAVRPTSLSTSPSVTFAPQTNGDRPVSAYEYAPSYAPSVPSVYALSAYAPASLGNMSIRTGGWGGRSNVADRDASVRAVRRKGSWESNESGWSWKGQGPAPAGVSRPSTFEGDEGFAAYYGLAGAPLSARDSLATAQTRLSRGSNGSWGARGDGAEDEPPGSEDKRFELDRAGAGIVV